MPTPFVPDVVHARVEVLSFFVFAYLMLTVILRFLWNALAKDFAWMPRLTWFQALAVMLVSGLFLYVVLTMISGARELMTPGAWRKDGVTHKLNTAERDEVARRAAAEKLAAALRDFAARNGGRLPSERFDGAIPDELWRSGDVLGTPFSYQPFAVFPDPASAKLIVAWEAPAAGESRWIVTGAGTVETMHHDELNERLARQREWR